MTTKRGGPPKGELHLLLCNAKKGSTFLVKDCSQTGSYTIAKRLGAKIRTEKLLSGNLRVWVDQAAGAQHNVIFTQEKNDE